MSEQTTPRVQLNILANLAGRAWAILSVFLFVPLYLNLAGLEGYAMITFYATLSAVLLVADGGLAIGLARELARDTGSRKQDLVRTTEVIFIGIALVAMLIIILGADFISTNWLSAETYSASRVKGYLILMAIASGTQLISSIYFGALNGLQQQVRANVLQFLWSLFRQVSGLVALLLTKDLLYFFICQIVSNVAYAWACRFFLLQKISVTGAPTATFDLSAVRGMMRFSGGVFAITLVSIIVLQSDKIIVSYLSTLKEFGVYGVAAAVAQAPGVLTTPVSVALIPRLTQLVSNREFGKLERIYHHGFRVLALLVIPLSTVLMVFSEQIIFLWTNNPDVTAAAHMPATLLITGSIFFALHVPAYCLALAYGETKYNIVFGSILAVVGIAGYFLLVPRLGLNGPGVVWSLMNLVITPLNLLVVQNAFKIGNQLKILVMVLFLSLLSLITMMGLKTLMSEEISLVPFGMIISVGMIFIVFVFIRFFCQSSFKDFIRGFEV